MASILSAGTTSGTALNMSGDTSGVLQLATNGTTTAVTIDTSQNVGIGETSPAGSAGYTQLVIKGTSGAELSLKGGTTQYGYVYVDSGGFRIINPQSGASSGTMQFSTSNTERMRIASGGALLVNATSQVSGTTYFSVQGSTASSNIMEQKDTGTSYAVGNYYQVYFNSTNGVAGGIAHNAAGTVAFNNSSDIRLKENIVDAPSVLDKVLNTKVRSYVWKEDKHAVQYGFIAQELYEHLPEAVGKGDDTETIENPNGTWQVEYGRLTPMLVKAIQELKAINDTQAKTINALTARIVALEQA